MKRLALVLALLPSLVMQLGCAKKDDLLVDQDWTKETASGQAPWREVESLFTPEESDANKQSFALRGVRHGLTMAREAAPTARCTCLDVVAGPANDPRFQWSGEAPTISPDQIAIAIRTEGSKCKAPEGQVRRPSIYAVDEVNGNTVVVVEELPADRPQALGAIVQLPANGRSIYVRARADKGHVAMYAQGPKGPASMCHLMTRGAEVAPAGQGD